MEIVIAATASTWRLSVKIGDLVRWKQESFIDDDLGIVTEVAEYSTAHKHAYLGTKMATVLWQKKTYQGAPARIRVYFLEVVNEVSKSR